MYFIIKNNIIQLQQWYKNLWLIKTYNDSNCKILFAIQWQIILRTARVTFFKKEHVIY